MAANKLTPAQKEFLGDLSRRSPQRVIAGYKPAARLSALGLATVENVDQAAFGWSVTITPEGAALAKATA